MRRLSRIKRDLTGNLPVLPAVYPDTMAPVVRTAPDGERELILMRWGFPPPPERGKAPVTNVRNLNFRPSAAGSNRNGAALFRQPRFANGLMPARR
jgi:putative SOS response-associated peptidase YedK